MKKLRQAGSIFVMIGMMFLTGCASQIPPYPGDSVAKGSMTTFQKDKAEFMVPAGWTYSPPSLNAHEADKGTFKKEGAAINVMCFNSPFLNREGTHGAMVGVVNEVLPKNHQIKGPYEINAPGVKPIFEAYAGEAIADGVSVEMVYLIASKWTRGFGCKYGLAAIAPLSEKDKLEQDFIALVQTLKN
jgi:hypothetical protein